jgi:hypothetical protein
MSARLLVQTKYTFSKGDYIMQEEHSASKNVYQQTPKSPGPKFQMHPRCKHIVTEEEQAYVSELAAYLKYFKPSGGLEKLRSSFQFVTCLRAEIGCCWTIDEEGNVVCSPCMDVKFPKD